MKKLFFLTPILFFLFNKPKTTIDNNSAKLNQIAAKYVTLGLTISQYDVDFLNIYYGPDSLRPTQIKAEIFPKDSLLKEVDKLQAGLKDIEISAADTDLNRAKWISAQLLAFSRRIKIYSHDYNSFDEESKELFGLVAPVYSENYYKGIVAHLDSLLPGKGSVERRFKTLASKFIIPKNKVDVVFKAAIAEARKRTLSHCKLPDAENLTLEYVTNKPWLGYNWYKGGYKSVVQINTDLPIFIDEAINTGSHESYPGHHVYNTLLEKNLYHDKGLVELSIFPVYSPQSLIAEGSANYGIELTFPGDEKVVFVKNVLLPLAGIDTTGISIYFKALEVGNKLNYTTNEAARALLNGAKSNSKALKYLSMNTYGRREISFIKKYRSYVINYNYGKDIVKNYIESKVGTTKNTEKRWELFGELLNNEVLANNLVNN